jgi:hypothetical protein
LLLWNICCDAPFIVPIAAEHNFSLRTAPCRTKSKRLAKPHQRKFSLEGTGVYLQPLKTLTMEYSRIVAVTGLPGLYEILSSKSDGAIVRSLDDGSTKFIASRVHNLSHLESIEVYTTGDNASLSDVFTAMKSSSEALPNAKDNNALKAYFEKAYPELDFERVYSSDMKKMVAWFGALQKHNIDFTPKEQPEDGEEASADNAEESQTNVAETLEAADEKVVLDVTPDTVPEVAKTKTKKK